MIYEHKGQQIQFDPGVTGSPAEILWTHNGNKVVDLNENEETVFGSFEVRVTLNRDTGRLQIFDLRLEDSGTYEYEIYLQEKWLMSSYELKVIGETEICFMSVFFFFQCDT